ADADHLDHGAALVELLRDLDAHQKISSNTAAILRIQTGRLRPIERVVVASQRTEPEKCSKPRAVEKAGASHWSSRTKKSGWAMPTRTGIPRTCSAAGTIPRMSDPPPVSTAPPGTTKSAYEEPWTSSAISENISSTRGKMMPIIVLV